MPAVRQTPLSLDTILELSSGAASDTGAAAGPWTLSEPAEAGAGNVAVTWQEAGLKEALAAGAGLLVLPAQLDSLASGRPRVIVADARLALARLSSAARPAAAAAGIHETAVIAPDASLAEGVSIGAHVVIGGGASVGAGTVIGPGSSVGDRSVIGSDCRIGSAVQIAHDVVLGSRVIVQHGAVLGSDGFGFAAGPQGAVRIEHLGRVELDDDVEIGANTTVDRATLGVTRIGARSKLDNLVQVGHNVTIGTDCLIAGQCAIGGSTVIGNGVTLAGNAAVADHVVIEDGAVIGALSGVSKRVPAGEVWFGIPAMPQRRWIRRQYLINRLEEIWAHVRGNGRR